MQIILSFIVVTVLMALSGCSGARSVLGDAGMYAADGDTLDTALPCPGCSEDAGQVDAGAPDVDAGMPGTDGSTPDVDAGTDSGMIVMDDAGSDMGAIDAGPPPCPVCPAARNVDPYQWSAGVCAPETGHCYLTATSLTLVTACPPGYEAAWWMTVEQEVAIENIFTAPGGGGLTASVVDTALYCPLAGGCTTSDDWRWAPPHDGLTPAVTSAMWATLPTSARDAVLHGATSTAPGLHAHSGVVGRLLCQSL